VSGADPGPRAAEAWAAGRLLALLWPRGEPAVKARAIGAFTLILGAKLISVGAPLAYKAIVDALSAPAVAAVPIALILAYGLAHVGVQLVTALRQLVFIRVAQRAVRLTALEVFAHLHALPLRFHLDRQTGGVSRIVARGVTAIEYLLELALFSVLPTLIELALIAAILWGFYSAGFALAVAATVLGYGGFTLVVTRRQVRARREMNVRDVAANVAAIDSLLNYETVKYFGAEAHEAARYEAARRAYERAAVRSESVEALVGIGQAAIIAVGLIVVMEMAGRGVVEGAMSVGDFVLVVAYLLQLYVPLGVLGTVYGNVKQSLADLEAMAWLLRQPVEIEDRPEAPALAVSRGHVAFDAVSFAYDPRRPILAGISFEVPAGGMVAVVGRSGAGKSTLARLLFRFYDVGAGTIRIDGQDLREVTQASLRRAIGVVPQDTVLFNETIYHNIAYGRPDAGRDEVEAAARAASLHDFIAALPDGYETQVGERGLKLSGGEKQRVAIARVVLKDPPVLILDEATSALDSRTEGDIQESLRAVSAERSTLVIAHRLSTIVDADEILVLDGGRIVERGRHAELLAAGGTYAAMWRRQRRAKGQGA
jgi:ATP-binding cassette, subfamily B, heavy metal transporter